MNSPRAILFDLGDTLIHFAGLDKAEIFQQGARAGHAYLVSQGVHLPAADKFVRGLLWRGRKAMLLNRLSRRELDVADLFGRVVGEPKPPIPRGVWRQFILRMYEPLAEAGRLDPQARPVLLRLRSAGLKVALVSNTFVPGHAIDNHLRRAGLFDLFDQRFYSARVGLKKPSLSLFRQAVGTLAVRPDQAWHVGDDLWADILGARRAGLTAVLRRRPDQPRRRVRWWWPIKPHHIIHQLDELLDLLGLGRGSA